MSTAPLPERRTRTVFDAQALQDAREEGSGESLRKERSAKVNVDQMQTNLVQLQFLNPSLRKRNLSKRLLLPNLVQQSLHLQRNLFLPHQQQQQRIRHLHCCQSTYLSLHHSCPPMPTRDLGARPAKMPKKLSCPMDPIHLCSVLQGRLPWSPSRSARSSKRSS